LVILAISGFELKRYPGTKEISVPCLTFNKPPVSMGMNPCMDFAEAASKRGKCCAHREGLECTYGLSQQRTPGI
jgi:hypothetical protein